ncbi:hypothetical protein [Neobacillus mesonae]|nr:hypothetical protein [Neobacillus mesonae]MCM3567144.1 hypothetical protein [Neobacillus mesonae]
MEVIQKQSFIEAMKDKTGSKNPKTVFHPGDEGQNREQESENSLSSR